MAGAGPWHGGHTEAGSGDSGTKRGGDAVVGAGGACTAEVERAGTRVCLRGEIDLTVRDALRSSLDDVIRAALGTLHIDAAEVSFMDSACAWEIRRACSVLDATGRGVALSRPAPAVVLVFSALGWRDVLAAMTAAG